jgi:mitochondrial fission protein ELM1
MAFATTAHRLRTVHRLLGSLLRTDAYHTPGTRTQPERVVLGVRSGVAPSEKPAVRIFVGTEPAQYQAERVFIWSIEQVRDPARVYELYLMKDLAGFDRHGWLTGFTNYRFAIPHFADGHGTAIYNDTDQIYLADPGELFDTAMGCHGFLSINDRDTSVMLIDCDQMKTVWTLEAAQQERRKALETAARAVPGLWGTLDQHWNARDDEYEAERSKLLHYTTIHAQPWQPFPQRYAYQHNPVAQLWFHLEQTANEAGYQVFQAAQPSAQYTALLSHLRSASSLRPTLRPQIVQDRNDQNDRNGAGHTLQKCVETLIDETGSHTVLDYSFGLGSTQISLNGASVQQYNSVFVESAAYNACDSGLAESAAESRAESADGVVCTDILDFVPDEDVPWMLEELFRRSHHFVAVAVHAFPYEQQLPNGDLLRGRPRPSTWWQAQLDLLSPRYPAVRWQLAVQPLSTTPKSSTQISFGGNLVGGNLGRLPKVWVLTSHKPGHTTQALGLADALDWPYETKALRFTALANLHKRLLGSQRAIRFGLDVAHSDPLVPPWPDLIITAGWRPARIARWIQRQSKGHTQLVLLGRKGSRPTNTTDIGVACSHFRLPPHPRRIETAAPLTQVTPERLKQGADQWRHLVQDAPHPWIMLLLGGATARYQLNPGIARKMGEDIRTFAERVGGKVFATTSRRTGEAETAALIAGLGPAHYVYTWEAGQQDNPYFGYLALADVLIVSGESESMLAEAATTATPFYIYPLPERAADLVGSCKEWIVTHAQTTQRKKRGSIRPQSGLSYVCARLIERGIVQPRRDLSALHDTLVQRKIARFFGEPLDLETRPALHEFGHVAQKVRRLLGFYTVL